MQIGMMRCGFAIAASLLLMVLLAQMASAQVRADDLTRRPTGQQTRWSSFENPSAQPGIGGQENQGAKGHALEFVAAGETKTLLDVKGTGSVQRIWMTFGYRNPEMLRSLRLEMFWDGAKTPAVSVPLGDFFGAILGRTTTFENEFFASPEGRSFLTTIPMPFRTGARITLTNESDRSWGRLFYDVNVLMTDQPDPDLLYFHSSWRRERPTKLEKDFQILPKVQGTGRFLGAHIGVVANAELPGWWGEGEVKMYLDGDSRFPTLAGTGTEDYIGTGWGQGVYHNRLQGSLVSDDKTHEYSFYRYHVPDPVYFYKDIMVTIQQIGGANYDEFQKMWKTGASNIKPVTVNDKRKLIKLLEPGAPTLDSLPMKHNDWVNYYREDDVSAVALFYLDRPENGLPPLAPVAERTAAMPQRQEP